MKSIAVKAVDTTGAGDSFVGGLLTSLASDLNLYQVCELRINGKSHYILHHAPPNLLFISINYLML